MATREKDCGKLHTSIEEAITHAEKNLDMFREPADPYWGSMKSNGHLVVGWEVSKTRRWRLDFDPDPAKNKWVHVNEENFDVAESEQKVVHKVATLRSDDQVRLYYRKWTSRYGKRPDR